MAQRNEGKKAKTKEKEYEAYEEEPRLYEVGYHLLPTIAEESLGEEVSLLKDALEKYGGVILSDEAPQHVTLAYPISRVFSGKRKDFTSAYFGWMRFQMLPSQVVAFNDDLRGRENVLRFLSINIPPEKKRATSKKMSFFEASKQASRAKQSSRASKNDNVSDSELDKTIEELVVE